MWKLSLLLSVIILTSTANSVEVTTDNLLSNSTFGTGTTYSNENWTITSEDYHNYTSLGGGNDPGGSVATDNATNIEQTISSLSTAAEMTVNEIRRGFSSKLSADVWYWNQYDNTTTLKQTITDNEGNVTTQQRVIADTGCGSINCGSYTNYTDTYIQGSNTKDDFSIKVNISNTNSRGSSHYGPDIDDIELKVTYTDVPPVEEDVEEELEDITEDIVDVVEDIEDDIEWEDDFVWEDTYFEEEFNTVWEDYGMEFNDEIYFEEEFVEFEEEIYFEEEFVEEFDTTVTMGDEFFDMEITEEAWEMPEDYEMTEMDTFFTEMSEDEWEDIETMSDEDFEEFLEEEFPEEFAEMQEESMEMEETVEMEEEMVFNEEETMEPPEEMIEEEEPEEMEVVEDDQETTEETAEAVEEEPESEEGSQEVAADENEANGEESIASDESIETEEEKTVAVKKEKIETVKEKIKAKIEAIKINEIKVAEVKPTLFSNQPNLEEYSEVSFYAPVALNYEVNDAFFEQMSLDMYNQQIYGDVTLTNYIQNDVVEVHRKKLEEISMKKRALMIELEALKNE